MVDEKPEGFSDEYNFTFVDNLFNHYTLAVDQEANIVEVFCERCNEVVFELDAFEVHDLEPMDLYEIIVKEHMEVGLVE